MPPAQPTIPDFRPDGYLPSGVHLAAEAEVLFRFGSPTRRRQRLVHRQRRWIGLARTISARRLLVDGSFVTAKREPDDIDAVILLPGNFQGMLDERMEAALELEDMLLARHPEEIFAAEDESDWEAWVDFFSRTREADGRRKGLVEVQL